MIVVYISVGLLVYIAIGGLLNGLFHDIDVNENWVLFGWPVVVVISLWIIIAIPFYQLGKLINTGIKNLRKRIRKK